MNLEKIAYYFEDQVNKTRDSFLQSDGIRDVEYLSSILIPNLLRALFEVSHKTLIAQYKILDLGITPDEYLEALRDSKIRDYLSSRYPVLRHWIGIACDGWLTQSVELCLRLQNDRADINRSIFRGKDPGKAFSHHFRAWRYA